MVYSSSGRQYTALFCCVCRKPILVSLNGIGEIRYVLILSPFHLISTLNNFDLGALICNCGYLTAVESKYQFTVLPFTKMDCTSSFLAFISNDRLSAFDKCVEIL